MFDFQGAVAVVTGASSGLGRRFCCDLAARGAVVTAVARRPDLLEVLADEMHRTSPASRAAVCDVTDTAAYVSLLAGVEREKGRIDLLVNDAGIGEPDVAGDDPLEPYRVTMETNFFAAAAGTLAVLPGMLDRGRGVIVNVSSDVARAPGPGEPAYAASKAALTAFTESLSFRTEERGVRLHVLYPGWVPTSMGQAAVDRGMPLPPKFVRRSEEQVSQLLLSRLGTNRVDIDAAPVGRLAPVARAVAPGAYRRNVRRAGG